MPASFAINSTYEELAALIHHVTYQFARQYNIPYDDLIGPANVAYVKAAQRYDRTHGAKLSSWVQTKVWYALMSHTRREIIRRHRVGELPTDENGDVLESSLPTTQPNNFRLEIESELSPHAHAVVSLLFDARHDLGVLFSWHTAKKRRVTSHQMLTLLREHLEDLGWPKEQIEGAFQEIRTVLAT